MEELRHRAMALADGELSAGELPALVAELYRNPLLLRLTQVFMALRRNRLARLYAHKADQRVPQWLIDTIMSAPMRAPARSSSNVFASGGSLIERLRQRYRMPGWSLAAGPALAALLAVWASWLLTPTSGHGAALFAAQFQKAIETTKSGDTAQLLTFAPHMTFRSKDQRFCRRFEVHSEEERSLGVACRAANGDWRIAMDLPSASRTIPSSNQKQLEDFIASKRQGDSLKPEEVEQLIGREWKK